MAHHIPVDMTIDVAVDHRVLSRVGPGPGPGTLTRSNLPEGRNTWERRVRVQRSRVLNRRLNGMLRGMLVGEVAECHIRQCGVRLIGKGTSVMRHREIATLK